VVVMVMVHAAIAAAAAVRTRYIAVVPPLGRHFFSTILLQKP
jgi:hypothetical protein